MRALVRKGALLVVILAALAWLFMKTLRDTNAEPYFIDRGELSGWTLALEDPGLGGPGLLVLRPPGQLVAEVFGQIFYRTGQSLASPTRASMPVVLNSEYAGGLKGILTPTELLEAGRKAGLESERLEPVCLGIKEDAQSGRSNQRFFLVFESQAFKRFREELARLRAERNAPGTFDAAALRPILPVASFVADFNRWWPLHVDTAADCQATIAFKNP